MPTPSEIEAASGTTATARGTLLVLVTPTAQDSLELVLGNLSRTFAGQEVLVGSSDLAEGSHADAGSRYSNLRLLAGTPAGGPGGGWVLTAADFLNAYKIAEQNGATACLLLGPESQSLSGEALLKLATAVLNGADLAMPHYLTGPREGLVNSGLLYPVNRAIFGNRARFPLAVDLGLSLRMASRLATVAQRLIASNQNDALIWPVAEGAVAGYSIVEVDGGIRKLPQPATEDLNTLLGQISASLFTEVETHAAFWQRIRVGSAVTRPGATMPAEHDTFPDVRPMIESFQIAYKNLHEIWSLVLPPNSLLGLKRLSQMPVESFRMGDSLWARTVYDFILAYRLRTINRGHLLGALTPLYLAWVASHILLAQGGTDPEQHIEEVAAAFETDKAYLVSRWRWPDRFNP